MSGARARRPLRCDAFRPLAAFICLFLFATPGFAILGPILTRPSPRYLQLGKPDQAKGAKLLEDFRAQRIDGDYYLAFTLRTMPRRGAEHLVFGRLWGSQNMGGPITRVELAAATPEAVERFLVQGGERPAAWRVLGNAAVEMNASALFEPLADTGLTMFEVQMPFLYWPDFVFEGTAKMRGRPAHVFLMYPPDTISAVRPELRGVRVYLDTQFGAMVQAEQIGANEAILKTLSIIELKKIEKRWIVKTIDLRDEKTRDKTRFAVTAALLGTQISADTFAPASLDHPAAPPSTLDWTETE